MKHTSGPWKIRGQDIYGKESNGYICTWSGSEANAHLISSAPTLLVACKIALSELKDVYKEYEINPGEIIAILKEAIAQAEGRE